LILVETILSLYPTNKFTFLKNTSLIFLLLGLLACKQNSKTNKKDTPSVFPTIIFIQPLGYFDNNLLSLLKADIETIFPVKLLISTNAKLPAFAWYAPRHRYWADSILVYLQPMHQKSNEYTLGITEEDISTKNGVQTNWGVMGLGFQPGHCSIVSTYRLQKYPQTQKQLFDKLLKVCLHELGHNFGLPHCANSHCIMTDAKGKDNLASENDFCEKCRETLADKGFQPKQMLQF
jgi:archaemetzincin